MALIPPQPVGVVPGSGLWNDWIEKIRSIVNGLLTEINWTVITGKPTTIAGYGITDPIEYTTNKNVVSGYAGLNASSRTTKGVDATDDLIVDLATKGLVLKDTQGTPHYWRITISNVGALVITDLGTTKP
jgi:hypothetical protein